jgi:hypothetical protein
MAYAATTMTVTVGAARARAAAARQEYPAADYGWENDEVYVIGFDFDDAGPHSRG